MIILIEFIVGIVAYKRSERCMRKTRFYDFLPFSSESVYFEPLHLLVTLSHSSEYNAHETSIKKKIRIQIQKNVYSYYIGIYLCDSSPERN